MFRYNPFGRLQETAPHEIQRRLIVKEGSIRCNDDANGSLIAVSYEARAAGVKRNDRGLEAIVKCPMLNVVQVPVKRGKADLSLYRSASSRVFKVLVDSIRSHSNCSMAVEIASIDEVYLDVTKIVKHMLENKQNSWDELITVASRVTTVGGIETMTDDTYAANALNKNQVRKGSRLQIHDATRIDEGSLGWWFRTSEFWSDTERMLAVGAFLAAHARESVLEAFGSVFTLSGGISSNKILAKLASGLKKPNRQTLIHRENRDALEKLFFPLPLDRIRGLGGKLGVIVSERLNVTTLGQLAQIPLVNLTAAFSEDMAQFLFDIGRGVCRDVVTERTQPKSIACGKTFAGKLAINNSQMLRRWTEDLCAGLTERISDDRDQNCRIPRLLTASIQFSSLADSHVSKSCPAPRALESYAKVCVSLMQKLALTQPGKPIVGLVVTAGSFVDVATGASSIAAAFQRSITSENQTSGHRLEVLNHKLFPRKGPNSKSSLDRWLAQGRDGAKEQIVRKSVCADLKRVHPFLCKLETKRKVVNDQWLSEHDIDPEVWKELPEDIRVSITRDLKMTQRSPSTKQSNSQMALISDNIEPTV